MGVIEYGDADVLDAGQARHLLDALRRVAAEDPRFREAGPYRAEGLVQPAMLADLQSTIDDPGAPFGLKLLLLEQLERAHIASDLAGKLASITRDPQRSFAERASAADALAALPEQPDWPALVGELWRLADQNSTRLAAQILGQVGFDLFTDQEIAEVVLAHGGVTICPIPRRRRDRVVGTLFGVRRTLPADRIGGVLDVLTDYLESLGTRGDDGPDDVTSLVVELAARAIAEATVTPDRLWHWLSSVAEEHGHGRHSREKLAAALHKSDGLRRALQKRVLLDATDDRRIWQRAHRLRRRSEGLWPSADDLLHLMGELDPGDRTDLRWRDLLEFQRYDDVAGIELRAAAKVFAAHRRDMLEWVDRLAEPRVPDWQERQEREDRRREAKRAMDWADHRAHFAKHIAEMRAGDGDFLVEPARCYMNEFSDVKEGLGPVERIVHRLGEGIATAALEGFEAYLVARPPGLGAKRISEGLADNLGWNAGSIIVAALGERMLSGRGFADLTAERVAAGWLLVLHKEDEAAGLNGLSEALGEELRRRRKWRSTLVLLIEPQLKRKRVHIDHLHELMNSAPDAQLATDLALGWLQRIKDMADDPEHGLVARVLASGRRGELSSIAKARLS